MLADEIATAAPDTEEYLTLEEATQFLGTSKPTLYRWLAQEEIKGFKAGKKWRFRKADLIAFLQRVPVSPIVPKEELNSETAWARAELTRLGDTISLLHEPGESDGCDRLAILIVNIAIRSTASDIHLEPVKEGDERWLRLRIRVDGALYDTRRIPFRLQEALLQAFKLRAKCDPTERRPQTGRVLITCNAEQYELRLSFLPTPNGDEMVARILHKGVRLSGLANLGICVQDIETIGELLNQPNGLILVVGPQGSGKSTLTYAMLELIVGEHRKSVTIEDPIEFSLPYTTQVSVGGWAGSNYAMALRAVMRHDPDIIMVGDLNDHAAAAMACEATLTGHLIISALNVGGTASAVQRLFDLSVAPFIVASTLIAVISARLIRKTCTHCRTIYQIRAGELRRYGFEIDDEAEILTLSRGSGCDQCRKTGYRGRSGLFEILTMNRELAAAIEQGEPADVIMEIARASGLKSMRQKGLAKVLAGETTPEEVMRVVYSPLQ